MLLFHECSETFAEIFEKFITLWHPNVVAVCLDVCVCVCVHTYTHRKSVFKSKLPFSVFMSMLGNEEKL